MLPVNLKHPQHLELSGEQQLKSGLNFNAQQVVEAWARKT